MSKINDIKSQYNIEDVIGQHIHLKRQGTQYVGNCPFHDDTHASLKISPSKQIFKCFVSGCGKQGDLFDFFQFQGHSFQETCSIITGGSIIDPAAPPKPVRKKEPEWRNATTIPDQNNLPDPMQLQHHKYNKPAAAWTYHDAAGNVNGFVCRFNLENGKKDVLPYTYKTDGNRTIWKWGGFDVPRPLYNLHELTSRPEAIVLLVEGEKTADAAKRLFPQYVVTTWIGGSESVKNADWTPLHGRRVFLWNDNDLAGVLCMFGGWSQNEESGQYTRVIGICEMFDAEFKKIQNSPDFPKKWDVADATWTPEEAAAYLKANRVEIPAVSAFPPNELPLPESVAPPAPPAEEFPVHVTSAPSDPVPAKPVLQDIEEDKKNPYFKCLGFEKYNDQNQYIFYVYRTNVVIKLSASGISTSNLLQLAPLNYWEGAFPKASRSGTVKFEINTVADHLISTCSKMGIFNPDNIRGRGAWIDNGVPVIHCGDTLIVDGVYTAFSKHKTRYIYEAGQELGFTLAKPATKQDAYKLIQVLERLNWGRDINARLLAGWIVIAPLCGALKWRSHMWLTGASGSGKSWIMINIIKKFLGQMFVDAQGATTEAGIRQFLGADALPVVFDEAESENTRGADRMQSVLEIMRASSTSDGGKIIKGSSGGSATQFNIRSCFAFASIGANITQRSDASRITVLEIKPDLSANKKDKWRDTLETYYETVTEEYIQAFQSRAIYLLPVILKNAATFSNAAAAELDNQRTGDQLGALLAGAYSLTSDTVISFEDARKWIRERDWSEERLSDSTRDEVKVLNKIMDADTNVETVYGPKRRTVGELVIAARGDDRDRQESDLITIETAKITLKRLGIRVEGQDVVFSDASEFISKALTGTAYHRNYHTILSRVNGAVKLDKTTFGSFIKSRATKIDSRVIFGELEDVPVAPEAPAALVQEKAAEVQEELF